MRLDVCVCVCRFAYVEFAEKEMVDEAVKLNESLFKGRQIKVQPDHRVVCGRECQAY